MTASTVKSGAGGAEVAVLRKHTESAKRIDITSQKPLCAVILVR